MDHLIIKRVSVRLPGDTIPNDKLSALIDTWLGQHATTANVKSFCRAYKKILGWQKYSVRFSEFSCTYGSLYMRVEKLKKK